MTNWLAKTRGEVLTNYSTTITVSSGPQKFYVVRVSTNETPPVRITPR